MLIDEVYKFNSDSPKLMEEVINSNIPQQEEYLSKLLNEQDIAQNLMKNYDLFMSKTIKFREFRQKSLGLLQMNGFPTPGSIINEVPEHMENVASASARKDKENSELKFTNLDIANQRDKKKEKSQEILEIQKNPLNISEKKDKLIESIGSFKNKLNESNSFMKEAEEHFEEEISLSQFKKINLSQNLEKEGDMIINKNNDMMVLDDLNENKEKNHENTEKKHENNEKKQWIKNKLEGLNEKKEKKKGFREEEDIEKMRRGFEERYREMNNDIDGLREEIDRKTHEIEGISFLILLFFTINS